MADTLMIGRQLSDTVQVTPDKLVKIGSTIAAKLQDPADPRLRREYVRLLVDFVDVRKARIRIGGRIRALAHVASDALPKLAPGTEREWRTRHESVRHSDHWQITIAACPEDTLMPSITYESGKHDR